MKRALPLIAAAVVIAIVTTVWVVRNRAVSAIAFDELSAANTGEEGTSLAFRYLARSHRTKMLTSAIDAARLEDDAVVFRFLASDDEDFAGDDIPDDDEADAKKPKTHIAHPLVTRDEDEWLRNGGRLVLATNSLPDIQVRNIKETTSHKVFPLFAGIETFALPERTTFAAATIPPHMHTVFEAAGNAVMLRQVIGRGELILISVPTLFNNRNLPNGDRLALLLALAGTRRPVYFDEVTHGITGDGGPAELLREWNFGPLLLLLAAAGLLIVWRNARRIGPAEDDHRDVRSEAVDLVASLGALYGKATDDAAALAAYHDTLVRTVAAQTGLRGEQLHRRVAQLTGSHTLPSSDAKLGAAELAQHLAIINDAFRKLAHAPTGALHADHR